MRHNSGANVLLVDDEFNSIRILSAILSDEGYTVLESQNAEKALGILSSTDLDAVVTDVKMPGMGGMKLFEHIKKSKPDVPVIFLTAFGTVESAVNAMTSGAFYYFIKPPDFVKFKSILARAIEQRRMAREINARDGTLTEDYTAGCRVVGQSLCMKKVLEFVDGVKDAASSVLITGETGTGKELIARLLHSRSIRRDKPFVAVNCAAIPRDLLESELFGSEKGAFTGAFSRRIGKFEEAAGGTLLLDEVGELELSLQGKLLRVLQEKEIERLGSNKKIKVDFRLVSSTNRDLRNEVRTGQFREDLFYRLNVLHIGMPPLRERMEDIPLLVSEFVENFCAREGKALYISDEVMEVFRAYSWPGNIRQLKNVVERAVVLARRDKITMTDLPEEFQFFLNKAHPTKTVVPLRELEIQAIKDCLEICKGNKSRASRMLGISRKAFYKRLREFGIS